MGSRWFNGRDPAPNGATAPQQNPHGGVSTPPAAEHDAQRSEPPTPQPPAAPQSHDLHLSADNLRRVADSRKAAALLGDVVSLLARSQHFKHYSLVDLEWLVLPALATRQFQMVEGIDPSTGARGPMALVAWANVSDDVEQRLRTSAGQPHRLRPDEWACGANAWLMLTAGDPRAIQGIFGNLAATQFKDRPLWLEQRDPISGAAVLTTLSAIQRDSSIAPFQTVG